MELTELIEAYNNACEKVEEFASAYDALPSDADADTIAAAKQNLDDALAGADLADEAVKTAKSVAAARERFKKEPLPEKTAPVHVDEPDMYAKGTDRFLGDLFAAQIKGDPIAAERIARHQAFEVEKYAVATGTLGGIIPPQYLVDMYAKASRNGRVFADQCNHQQLPDVGMSMVVPRLTQGLAAGIQASESTTAATQDPTETDLTVPVRTIAGYSPVSRQTLERASYSEAILFEDLIARYWATLDTQAISGSGSSGQMLGALNTSGISSSTVSTATVAAVWPKFSDISQQIDSAMGGLGYKATKCVMHPRRWGFFTAALDASNRPLFLGGAGPGFNALAEGQNQGYGPVGQINGLPVYTDANIPTNLGGGTNQDVILVFSDPVVHLWERNNDPVTLGFEQQAGTSLQVQLVAYGYAAFTAGRYPAAFGTIGGTGLVPPTF